MNTQCNAMYVDVVDPGRVNQDMKVFTVYSKLQADKDASVAAGDIGHGLCNSSSQFIRNTYCLFYRKGKLTC